MTLQELQAFRDRCQYATSHKFQIARAEEYAEILANLGAPKEPPEGVKPLSAAHLLAMVRSVLSNEARPKPKTSEVEPEAKVVKKSALRSLKKPKKADSDQGPDK